MAYKDPGHGRACDRERYRRRTAERLARGMCPRCGEARPEADHSLCQSCGDKRRKAELARCAKARAAGMLYGGRDAERCRRSASNRSKQRERARRDVGLCMRCGKQKPVEGRTVCEPCRQAKGEREREQYAARRAAGECGKCGAPAVAPLNPICRRNPSIPGLCRIASPTCARPFELSLPWSVRLSSAARRCILRTLPCDSSLPP